MKEQWSKEKYKKIQYTMYENNIMEPKSVQKSTCNKTSLKKEKIPCSINTMIARTTARKEELYEERDQASRKNTKLRK